MEVRYLSDAAVYLVLILGRLLSIIERGCNHAVLFGEHCGRMHGGSVREDRGCLFNDLGLAEMVSGFQLELLGVDPAAAFQFQGFIMPLLEFVAQIFAVSLDELLPLLLHLFLFVDFVEDRLA